MSTMLAAGGIHGVVTGRAATGLLGRALTDQSTMIVSAEGDRLIDLAGEEAPSAD